MKIVGLMVVRNEVDILRINLLHHLSAGIDEFLVVDNGSSDGSERILEELAKDGRLHWTRDDGDYRQAEITTELARHAYAKGADWVIPIDADEFWCAPRGNLRDVLNRSRAAGIEVQLTNFIQQRDQRAADPGGLLRMTRRAPIPVGSLEQIRDLVENKQFSYVEVTFPSKWISRASESLQIRMGNHELGDKSVSVESTDEIVCLHAPLRSRSILDSKVEQGRRVAALGLDKVYGWHVRRWARIADEGELEIEWAANSYADEALDVYGALHPVVFDPRLRDVVRPWIEGEARESRRTSTGATTQAPLGPTEPATASPPSLVSDIQTHLQSALQERRELLRTIQLQLSAVPVERNRAVSKLSQDLAHRDRMILDLGEELRSKVGERDTTIRRLQKELREKVHLANQTIQALNAEMQEQVGQANRTIDTLHAEMEEQVGQANRTIDALGAELHEKVGEANRKLAVLNAEMKQKICETNQLEQTLAERNRTITSLEEQLRQVTLESERALDELTAERDEQEKKVTALFTELTHIKQSNTWRLLSFYLKIRRTLLHPFGSAGARNSGPD